jgi:plastocyanin
MATRSQTSARPSATAHHRPGRLAVAGGVLLALGLAGIAAAWSGLPGSGPMTVEIPIRYSHYERPQVTVPAGVPITFVLRNGDPIDHEWIVGDAAVHERHRTGTEPVHASRPTEVSIVAGTTAATTITFSRPGTYLYVCHLPGHEAYGMVGTLRVTGG